LVVANRFKINPTRLQQEAPRFSDHARSPDHRIARLLTERGRLSGSYRLFNPAKPVAALWPVA
jgi:hypothetical protein